MPLSLKLTHRDPAAPRLSLRERYAALKGSAAKVIGKPARFAPPKPIGAGEPSKALVALIDAHQLAYARYLIARLDWTPDLNDLRQAEEAAFRVLLHSPLRSDADRVAYAIAVIERQSGALGDHVATGRDHPLSVAYRSLRFGEHAREVVPETAADPIIAAIAASKAATAAFDAFEDSRTGSGLTADQQEHEAAICDADMKAQRAVWQTVPTTPVGRRALVEFARFRVARVSRPDGDVDDAGHWLGLILDAFSAMVEGEGQLVPGETAAARVDTYDHKTGLVSYADAAGTVRTKPAAEWIAFMAARLNHIARTERSRQFNAACNDLDGAACAELEARLTRELRIDAVNALAHRFDQVFGQAQALRDGGDGAGASAAKVDLTPLTVLQLVNLHDAYRAAQHLWEGVAAKPYSVASRDVHGCIHQTVVGRLADFEETRAGLICDRIVDEITSRSPKNERERDYILSLRLQHEINCEGRIRDADMMREIAQAWGA